MGWFALLALVGSGALDVLIKKLFARSLPDLWPALLPETDSSFPRGHVMFAAAWRTPAVVLGILYMVGMVWPRVYLGVHSPSNVAAGACFSLAWIVLLSRAFHLLAPRNDPA